VAENSCVLDPGFEFAAEEAIDELPPAVEEAGELLWDALDVT
jgi:hypothetical protein